MPGYPSCLQERKQLNKEYRELHEKKLTEERELHKKRRLIDDFPTILKSIEDASMPL